MKNYTTKSQVKNFIDKVHDLPISSEMKYNICLWHIAEMKEKLEQITSFPSREVNEKDELRNRYGI